MRLAEVRVGRWGGFVFINRDASAAPLEALPREPARAFCELAARRRLPRRQIRKTIQANWKTCIEGFIESMHVAELHAQASPFSGDSSTQYDVWRGNENISRFLEPSGVQSEETAHGQMRRAADLCRDDADDDGTGDSPPLPAGTRARTAMAELSRKVDVRTGRS